MVQLLGDGTDQEMDPGPPGPSAGLWRFGFINNNEIKSITVTDLCGPFINAVIRQNLQGSAACLYLHEGELRCGGL